MESIKASMAEKELEMTKQLSKLKQEMEGLKKGEKGLKGEKGSEALEQDLNSKKFFINVLETRLKRQQAYSKTQALAAEKKIRADPRITKFLQ